MKPDIDRMIDTLARQIARTIMERTAAALHFPTMEPHPPIPPDDTAAPVLNNTPRRGPARKLSAASRAAISRRMRAYWRKRRKGTK